MSKTIKVSKVLEFANEQLKREDHVATQSFKRGITVLLEKILLSTDNYEGFNFIPWLEGRYEDWMEAGQPEGPRDYYSRKYFKSPKL